MYSGEKQGRNQDNAHMSPAVKRMKQAHCRRLLIKGAGLYDRAYQHLDQPPANCIEENGGQHPHIGIRQKIRKDSKTCQAQGGKDMGNDNRGFITNPIHEAGGQQIHHQLNTEINGDQQCYFFKGNPVRSNKCGKKKGDKVIYNGLGDIAQIAGI